MAKPARPKKVTTTATMPAAGQDGETTSGYFRRIFKENPSLLGLKSNDELFRRWLGDHPGHTEVPKNVKGNLFNVKSVLRHKGRKKLGRPKKVEQGGVPATIATTPPKPVKIALKGLEALEEQIDDALTVAKRLDRESLDDVIRILRKARNTVVCKLGE